MVQINNSTNIISYNEVEVVVPANKQYVLYSPYNTIQLLESNAIHQDDLSFRFGSSAQETPFTLGLNPTFPEVLASLTITNKTGADITIRLALIVGDMKDNRLNVSGTLITTTAPLENIIASQETFDNYYKQFFSYVKPERGFLELKKSYDERCDAAYMKAHNEATKKANKSVQDNYDMIYAEQSNILLVIL